MSRILSTTLLAFFTFMMVSNPTFADEPKPMHGSGPHDMRNKPGMPPHDKIAKKKGHQFSPHWSETLTDEQKAKVDRMHLELDRELSVLKAQEELAQKELNVYTVRDDAKMATINAKIDALLAVEKQILQQRYAHLIEMRKELTSEQRISYDMAVLKRSGAK